MNVAAKASIWYTLCNIIQKGIAFLVVPIYTRLLTTVEYGSYSTFQSWKDIIIIFATLNLYCGVFTKAMVDLCPEERNKYTSSMQGLTIVVCSIFFVLYLSFFNYVNPFLNMDFLTVFFMFLYFAFSPSISFWSVRQRVEYKYIKMVIVTILIALLVPMISLILLHYSGLRERSVIWGYLFVNIAIGIVFFIFNFIKGKVFFDKVYWINALKFNVPLIPHYLSLIILGQSDRIMIQKMVGEEAVAFYSLAHQIAMLMTIVISGIDGALVPWEYENFKNKNYKKVSNICLKIAVAIGVMIVAAALVSPEITWILGGDAYYEAIWVIPSISLSVFFTYIYGLFSTIEFYYGNTKFVMIASTLSALLNVVLNYIFIGVYGYIAAAYTTLLCYIFLASVHFLFSRIVEKRNGIVGGIYNAKILLVVSIMFLLTLPLCLFLYNHTAIRYFVIIIIILGFLFGIKWFKSIFRSVRINEKKN